MQIDVLCGVNDPVLGRRFGSAMGARSVPILTTDPDSTIGVSSEASRLIAVWSEFLDGLRQSTRYNNPQRFIEGLAVQGSSQPQSLAVLFSTDRLRAVIVSHLRPRDTWRGAGRISQWLPGLDCLAVNESCIVTDGSAEAITEVSRYLSGILRAGFVQRIEVHNLEVGSALQSTLSRELERGFRVLHKDYVRFSRRLRDGVTGEPVVINSAKTRQSLRRKQRNLEQQFDGDLKFVQVINPDQTDAFVRDAAGIVAQTYQTAIGIGVRDDTAMRDYLRILAQEGTLRGYEFVGRGEPIAYVLGDVTNGTFHLWATSFLPKYSKLSPGIVLLNRVFDALTEEGATLFDFGHRDAEYKRLLGNELQQEEEVRVYGSGLVPSAAFFLDYASDSLRNIARKTLVRFGQIDRTRKVWRNYLQRSSAP